MTAMRLLPAVVLGLFLAPLALAQHQHHDLSLMLDTPVPNAVAPTGVTRTFTVTARQFTFDITPSPFKVNLGDTVVINATSSDVVHGLLMERYITSGLLLQKGKTVTKTFTADQAGDFLFACDQSSCGVGHTTMTGTFSVAAATPPAITNFQPTTGSTNGGTAVTITGTNFQSGATVKFGNLAATSVNVQSATSVVATSPAQGAGAVTITVTNPDGQSATANGFTYVVPGPSASSIAPPSGPTNGGTSVTITGANFQPGAMVTFGAKSAFVTLSNSSTLIVSTPAAVANEQQGVPLDIKITNPDGQSITLSGAFQYTAAPLSITAISPGSGSNAGGATVSISGTGFTSALEGASVKFGGVAATNLTVLDAATLTVKAPVHANGTVDVAVTMGGQTITALAAFTYENAPPRRRTSKH